MGIGKSQKITLGLVATGGTISMLIDSASGHRRPALHGRDLFESLPAMPDIEVLYSQPYTIASHEVTFAHWQHLAAAVKDASAQNDSVVVIHGTDTMEEAAFFLAECLGNPDIILVGAMRPLRSVRGRWTSKLARRGDCCVKRYASGSVRLHEPHSVPARSVTKRDTVSFDAFASRCGGPLGFVQDGALRYEAAPVEANWLDALPSSPVSAESIALVPLAADPSVRQVVKLLNDAEAVLVESIATGSIPMSVRREILAAAREVPVVVTTRCYSGPVRDEDDYPRAWDDLLAAGVYLEDRLDTYKARIRLALSMALDRTYEPFDLVRPAAHR